MVALCSGNRTVVTHRIGIVMNGVTGAIAGEYPKSPWKIALLVLALFVGVLIFLSLAGGR